MFKVRHGGFGLEKSVRDYEVCRKHGVLLVIHAMCWKVCCEPPSCS